MKKAVYIISILFICLSISCSDYSDQELYERKHTFNTIRAFMGDLPTSRTHLKNGGKVVWDIGDKIVVFDDEQMNFGRFTCVSMNENNATFTSNTKISANHSYAFYPYENISITENQINYWLPGETEYVPNTYFRLCPMVAESTTNEFNFKHVCGILKFSIKGTKQIKRLELWGNNNEAISGYGYIDLTSENPILSIPTDAPSSGRGIIMSIDNLQLSSTATDFYFIVPPIEFSKGLSLNITYLNDDLSESSIKKSTSKSITVSRSVMKTFSIFDTDELIEEQEDRIYDALMNFYNAASGDKWINNTNWGSEKPFREWYGITEDEVGRVVEIILPSNNLRGDLTSCLNPLFTLEELRWLDLSIGSLTGEIPNEINKFKNLETLSLWGNQLSGKVPTQIGELQKLSSLWLMDNQLIGEVSILNSIPNLSSIAIERNKFTGNLPDMPLNVRRYTVSDNLFTGSIPENHIRAFEENLRSEYGCSYEVHNNNLSGNVPICMTSHENWHIHWFNILPQNPGYGFAKVDIPAHSNIVKCYDDTYLNLGEEYKKNKYTLIFRADPDCPFSAPYISPISQLFNKYRDQGLGLVCTTTSKYSNEEVEHFFSPISDAKIFWEVMAGQGHADMSYNNNPYDLDRYFFLFRFGVTPYFHIVNNEGNFIFLGSGAIYNGTVPQYHENRDDVFNFIANLFGDTEFIPDNDLYTSTDYSHDGEVVTLQTASVGKGINLTFMGEAFVDKDMEPNGLYEQKMQEAMEKLFSIEPYKSMRNRFNVYAVKVISPNAEFSEYAEHRINESDSICFEYAQKIPNADKNPPMVSVVYNTTYWTDRSYTTMYTDGAFVGYMMDGISDVLIHEIGGHGFANLLDEYVESGLENSTLSQDEATLLDNLWKNYSWGANVDWRNDASTVKWTHFLNDSRYAGEGLGLYEGAYLYGYGAYRPTKNSMMRYNDSPFNAPSREQIYKRIMQRSEGEDWKYNYEEFVKYDVINRNAESRSAVKSLTDTERREYTKNHRPPTIIKGTWRDAMKGKSQIVVPLR